MRFVLAMAARETRAAWARLVFFFVCVAVGVGAIIAIRSVVGTARVALTGEARALLAADVSLQTNSPWNEAVRALVDRRLAQAPVEGRTETIDTATLARPADGREVARMVELRGVQADYPFYGAITLEDGRLYTHALVAGGGALVRPELLPELGVAVGDRIVLGRRTFTIRGVIKSEPGGQVSGFSLGPRVLVDYGDLLDTGLLTFGSRATWRLLLRVPGRAVDPLVRELRADLRGSLIRVRSYRTTGDRIGDDLQRAENYLSLVGFVMVVLGGIGVWSVTRVFMRQKMKTIAVLKCLGCTTRQVLATYLVQVVALGLAGSALGAGLAWVAVRAIPSSVTDALGAGPVGLTPAATLQGLGVGLLVSVLFAAVPLLEARHVRPLLLLRQEVERRGAPRGPAFAKAAAGKRLGGLDRLDALAIALVATGLVATAGWQAGSLKVGLFVCGGFAIMAAVLYAMGAAVVRAVAPLARGSSFPLRHAVLGLRRPGNQTRVILLAVGLGSFFVLAARGLQDNLLAEISVELRSGAPDLFLIDVQPDQVEGARALLAKSPAVQSAPVFIPVLRARVIAVRGRAQSLEGAEEVRGRGSLGREFVVTWRDRLAPNERLIAGRWWDAGPPDASPVGEVSIEQGLRARAGIQLGDLLRFDISGRAVEARVTSIRDVDWEDSTNGGFMFVFRPGLLDRAPHTFIAPLRVSPDPAARARLQHDLVVAFPNVSAIDVREILARVRSVVDAVTLAVSIVGTIALASGLLILVGAVAMTKFQRVYEAAILRTLGATTRTIATMLALEYSLLGLAAGLVGGVGALGLGWTVARHLLDIPWRPPAALTLGGMAACGLLVGAVGVLASLDVLRRKPLATLRAE